MSVKTTMACPACLENGSDKSGNHLTVFPGGKFCCAVHPRGKAHNRRIIELRPELGKENSAPFSGSKRLASHPRVSKKLAPGPVVARYSYHDQSGQEVYQVWRHEPKDFSQHRIINGEARPTMEGVARVPYRLPEVLKAEIIWIVEGEKDADTLAALHIVATCNAGGAKKWDAAWSHYFTDKEIILCGDNDEKGREHIDLVDAVLKGVAKSIRRVEIPAPAKDISDQLAGLSDTEARSALEELLRQPDSLDTLLDARRLDLANPPDKPVPVLLVTEKPSRIPHHRREGTSALDQITPAFRPIAAGHKDDPHPVLGFGREGKSAEPRIEFRRFKIGEHLTCKNLGHISNDLAALADVVR
jgi:5S rRNA maturation endonuclease (ribonuclease M5)